MSYKEDNKRLAKNTFALYIRNFGLILISLYVSRLLLQVLGFEDFGTYNVVGSIVVLFSFLNWSLTAAIQRYITYELGTGNIDSTIKVFSAALIIQLFLSLLIIAFIEPIGYWLINYELNIPHERLTAANWAFQFSIMTFLINMSNVPYEATVIANEKMTFFAYVGISDAFLKLALIWLLSYSSTDKLIFYAFLLTLESFFIFLLYRFYCNRKFASCKFVVVRDKSLYKRMLSFSGWTLTNSAIGMISQKVFIFLLNIFYGVTANAAMGIANQVSRAISNFSGGFLMSSRPQIVKSYAQQDYDHLNKLVITTTKISFSLMAIPIFILMVNMPLVLSVWLSKYPPYTVEFCQMMLICALFDATSVPLNSAVCATERIKYYSIAISISSIIDVSLCFLLFKMGVRPYFILVPRILTRGLLDMLIGIFFIQKLLPFHLSQYIMKVVMPICLTIAILFPVLVFLPNLFEGWHLFFISSPLVAVISFFCICYIILGIEERSYIKHLFKERLSNSRLMSKFNLFK